MNSLFHLLTGFWSMLLLMVGYIFYSQPQKALASIAINPKLVTFALFIQPRTMIAYCSFKTNPARKEKFRGFVFDSGVLSHIGFWAMDLNMPS